MSYTNNRSAPTSPGHHHQQASSTATGANNNRQQSQNNQTNNNQNRRASGKGGGFFGSGSGGNGFDFTQFSQNISNSFQDIFSNNLFNGADPLMDVRKMLYKSCNSCGTSFSVFLRKKRCQTCMLHFCHSCMELSHRGTEPRGYRCKRCLVFANIPLTKDALNTLRVRDLKWFLSSRNIPAETYSEKRELIDLIIVNVNPPPPQSSRRSSGSSAGSQANRQQQQSRQTSPQSEQPPSRPSSSSTPSSPQYRATTTPTQPECSFSTSTTQSTRHPNEPTYEYNSNNEARSSQLNSTKNAHSNLNISTFNLNDVKDEADIKDLSVRQLKLLLTRNFVDFKGCVEREELIQKAVLLWQDRQIANKFKDENETNLEIDENVCKICMENAIDCVLLECGHMLTCTECGKILSECPVCRQFVTRVVHVFKA